MIQAIRAGETAAFVLVGGKSLRMGTDKALLPFRGGALAQHAAEQAAQAAHPVCFVGDPARYIHLGYETIPDAAPDRGPLSGIEAALLSRHAKEWNLVLACDMPRLTGPLLLQLVRLASQSDAGVDCIVPRTAGRLQPLCALYRARCAAPVTRALAQGTGRVVDMIAMLQASIWDGADSEQFGNVNTWPEWSAFLKSHADAQQSDTRRISPLP